MPNNFIPFHQNSKAKTMIQHNPVYLNVSKKILARQSIFRNIDCNIVQQIKKGHSFLTQQQIKISSIYQKLLQRIQKAKKKQDQQSKQHERTMQRISNEIKYLKTSVQQDKVQIWQVKNEVMELEQLLDQQVQEYNQICDQIHAQEQQDDDLQEEDQNDDQNMSGQIYDSENSQNLQFGSQSSQTNKSQQKQSYSKPSCSIKYFISNRSITSPDLSQQNLQVGSGRALHTGTDHQDYTQLYVRDQRQESNTDHNLLSFKKTQNLFCQHQ